MIETAVPILASLNAKETIEFYTEKLAFSLIANWDGYLIFSKDKIQIHLWPCNDIEIPKATGCYLRVTEVDQLYAQYLGLGVVHPNGKLELKPWRMKQFSVLDNNGNIIHFGEELK